MIAVETVAVESSAEIWKLIGNGAAVALIIAVIIFFRFLASERKSARDERSESAKQFREALEAVTADHRVSVDRLVAHLDSVRDSHVRIEAKLGQVDAGVQTLVARKAGG